MPPRRRFRLLFSVIFIGVVPLTLANVIGFGVGSRIFTTYRSEDSGVERRIDWGIRTKYWNHGWPFPYLVRQGQFPTAKTQWPPGSQRPEWASYREPGERPYFPPTTSRWPFDRAIRLWRYYWLHVLFNVVVWAVLLLGTGTAAAQSRFVQTGKVQFALGTYLVTTTFVAFYLGANARALIAGWEPALLLPVLTSAVLGYASLARSYWRRRGGCGFCERSA